MTGVPYCRCVVRERVSLSRWMVSRCHWWRVSHFLSFHTSTDFGLSQSVSLCVSMSRMVRLCLRIALVVGSTRYIISFSFCFASVDSLIFFIFLGLFIFSLFLGFWVFFCPDFEPKNENTEGGRQEEASIGGLWVVWHSQCSFNRTIPVSFPPLSLSLCTCLHWMLIPFVNEAFKSLVELTF